MTDLTQWMKWPNSACDRAAGEFWVFHGYRHGVMERVVTDTGYVARCGDNLSVVLGGHFAYRSDTVGWFKKVKVDLTGVQCHAKVSV